MIPGNTLTNTTNISDFISPYDELYTPLSNIAMGGTALGDISLGRNVKRWIANITSNAITVGPEFGAVALNIDSISASNLSLAFDRDMHVVLAIKISEGTLLFHYDTSINNYKFDLIAGATSCKVSVDKMDDSYISQSDVVYAYTLDGNLCFRQESENYSVEHIAGPTTKLLIKMGPSVANKLQFQLVSEIDYQQYIDTSIAHSNQVKYTVEGTDEYLPYVVLLLQGNDKFIDDSPLRNNLIVTNTVTIDTTIVKFGTGSIKTLDDNSSIKILARPEFTLSGDFTIECWFYPYTSTNTYRTILNIGTYTNGILFRIQATNFDIFINSGNYSIAKAISLNQWHHAAVSRTNGVLYRFIDGVLLGAGVACTAVITSGDVLIGRSSHTVGEYLNGNTDVIRITNGKGRYTATFPLPTIEASNANTTRTLTATMPPDVQVVNSKVSLFNIGLVGPMPTPPYKETVVFTPNYAYQGESVTVTFAGYKPDTTVTSIAGTTTLPGNGPTTVTTSVFSTGSIGNTTNFDFLFNGTGHTVTAFLTIIAKPTTSPPPPPTPYNPPAPSPVPVGEISYTVTLSKYTLDEGDTISVTATGGGATNNTTLAIVTVGNSATFDLNDVTNWEQNKINIVGGTGSNNSVTITLDNFTEGTESFKLMVFDYNKWLASPLGGTTVAGPTLGTSAVVTVNDTSKGAPTYSVHANSTRLNEGSSVTFTVTTTNVPDGTKLFFLTANNSSGMVLSDITWSSPTGSFLSGGNGIIVNSNTATFTISATKDGVIEPDEQFQASIYSYDDWMAAGGQPGGQGAMLSASEFITINANNA